MTKMNRKIICFLSVLVGTGWFGTVPMLPRYLDIAHHLIGQTQSSVHNQPETINHSPLRPEITLTFLGDLMAHRPNFEMRDFSRIYSGLGELLLEDDLTFANLEFVVDPDVPYSTYPRFNVHPPYVWAALEAGVDVFSLANNHTNDHGLASTFATLRSLELLRNQLADNYPDRPMLTWSGIREALGDPFEITPIQYRGWHIGFLSITDFLNDYTGSASTYLVPFWDRPAQERLLDLIRQESPKYDLFILAFHSGDEYVLEPPPRVQRMLHALYDAGAHIVWGHHPHVIQPWEVRYAQDLGQRVGFIMPSMGNFISGQTWRLGPEDGLLRRAYTGDTAVLRLRARWDYRSNRPVFGHPTPIWISTHNTWFDGQRETHLRLQKDLLRELHGPWLEFFTLRHQAMLNLTREAQQMPDWFLEVKAQRYGIER